MSSNQYTDAMTSQSNVTPILDDAQRIRRARGAFVKSLIDAEDRSARYIATRIGISPTSMSERLRGKAPFLADELEGIARALKMDPADFYSQYISVGPDGFEPTTSTVEYRRLAQITPLFAVTA